MPGTRIRIDLAPGLSIGPGKIALLEAIDQSGSLSAAARSLGMSYRRAWLLVDSLNHTLPAPVTTATVGGRGGGGVTLTPSGRDLVRRYRLVESTAERATRRHFTGLEAGGGARDAGRPGLTRRRPSGSKRP